MKFWSPCLHFGMHSHRAFADFTKSWMYFCGSYETQWDVLYLLQTLERTCGKIGRDGIFGVQDMAKQFLSFVHQESCVHTLVWQISSFLTRLFILSVLHRQWKKCKS